LRQAGRLVEAVTLYERALARWPDLPDCWYNLALSQRQLGRFPEALSAYQHALERNVTCPEEVRLNRGVIFSDHLRQADAAEAEWHAALELNPNYLPALLNLANLREEQARRDEALVLYEHILAHDPHHTEALARYASLKRPASPDDPLVARVIAARDSSRTSPAEKASLGFALGKVLDACGAYDDAYAAYVRANRDSRDSARGLVNYNRRRHEQFVGELIATFATAQRAAAKPSQAAPPIFICGMFRSGSTLVEQILASHPHVTAGGEIDFLPTLVRSELALFPAAMKRVSADKLIDIARRYRDRLRELFPGAERITDKRPDNFLYIGLIKALFPDARIVNTVRDPLDNCLSVYFLHLDHSMSHALDLLDTAHYYRHYRRLMAHWKSLYGPDILDFDYDAFVRDPRPAIRDLLAFCGLEWNDSCLAFHQTKNVVKTESVWQVREPLYQRASGRWRNYARHLERLRGELKDFVDEGGKTDHSW
jgi:tetratricopeptide (TPR) repeat protein